jgi:hypothetical protein
LKLSHKWLIVMAASFAIVIWQIPWLYNLAVKDVYMHYTEHLTYMASGFWLADSWENTNGVIRAAIVFFLMEVMEVIAFIETAYGSFYAFYPSAQ